MHPGKPDPAAYSGKLGRQAQALYSNFIHFPPSGTLPRPRKTRNTPPAGRECTGRAYVSDLGIRSRPVALQPPEGAIRLQCHGRNGATGVVHQAVERFSGPRPEVGMTPDQDVRKPTKPGERPHALRTPTPSLEQSGGSKCCNSSSRPVPELKQSVTYRSRTAASCRGEIRNETCRRIATSPACRKELRACGGNRDHGDIQTGYGHAPGQRGSPPGVGQAAINGGA